MKKHREEEGAGAREFTNRCICMFNGIYGCRKNNIQVGMEMKG